MNRPGADNAHKLLGTDLHHLAQEGPVIKTANSLKLQHPAAVNLGDHQAHLIHVGIDQYSQIELPSAPFERDEVAHRIHTPLVHVIGDQIFDKQPNFFFRAGYANGFC